MIQSNIIGHFQIFSKELDTFETFCVKVLHQIPVIKTVERPWYDYAKRVDDAIFMDNFQYVFEIVNYDDDDYKDGCILSIRLVKAWMK